MPCVRRNRRSKQQPAPTKHGPRLIISRFEKTTTTEATAKYLYLT
ncbi:hypothetical protein GMO_20390 [Gluconobacter morbifer G707]|uniref:Uncharacterized protein n=1 Tax=Gluconobacter morbifer G707 TaxID=1088869 RepID=G6XKM3_9PROT|nr:hypothetical protein GMO_20390 [Gluconobacter morbifer G707]